MSESYYQPPKIKHLTCKDCGHQWSAAVDSITPPRLRESFDELQKRMPGVTVAEGLFDIPSLSDIRCIVCGAYSVLVRD